MIRTIHRAKYVLADSDLILQNGSVYVSDAGRILRVESWNESQPPAHSELIDWGSAVIMPGLINCHAHLELTHLRNQIVRFSSFTDWLSQVVAKRREWAQQEYSASTLAGAEMALSSGTVLIGDISASGASWRALKASKLRKIVFEEAIALSPHKAAEASLALEARLDKIEIDELLSSGVSPHAPYSVSSELYRAAARIARERNLALATHVAETREEVSFLYRGTGEFREFLTRLEALPPGWTAPNLSPIAYLATLGVLDRPALLIHCNYLNSEAMSLILASRSSVIYCPRSHAFFGHEAHPVRQLLDLGINVALGTDSLASNSTLSMLDEMRFLFSNRKDLKCDEIIRMATLNGATALNLGSTLGRLKTGYWADMAIVKVPEEAGSRNLAAQILEGAGDSMATIIRGEVVWQE